VTLTLRNPHSVLAALESRPGDVLEVRLPPQRATDAWQSVAELARSAGIAVRTELPAESRKIDRGEKSERQGAASAFVRERNGISTDELWADVAQPPHGLWLALDCLQDPHNVGAIFRTAAFFGVRGIILTKDRSAPMTGTVYDVASGGVEAVPFALVTNLASTLRDAKQAGLWPLGSSEHAVRNVTDVPHDRPWLLVIGNEEQGLRRLTLDLCDDICRIPPRGAVTSLNASVAAGVLIAALTQPVA
jgi:23S rRNA (guanosine2251-2'-O)-methyltransferase